MKKVLSILLLGIMSITALGCSKNEENNDGDNNKPGEEDNVELITWENADGMQYETIIDSLIYTKGEMFRIFWDEEEIIGKYEKKTGETEYKFDESGTNFIKKSFQYFKDEKRNDNIAPRVFFNEEQFELLNDNKAYEGTCEYIKN